MPIYEFNCQKCKENFEELVFGDEIPPCPKCGNKDNKKLLSRATLHTPAPSRAGRAVSIPSSSSGCGGCSGGNCSSCGS